MILFLKVLNGAKGLVFELSEVRFEWLKFVEVNSLINFGVVLINVCRVEGSGALFMSAETGGTPYKSRKEISAINKKTSTCAVER